MKTFYSVDYAVWGADRLSRKWFDSLEAAREFAKQDYTESVVVHNYRNHKAIEEIEELIENQDNEW